MRSLVYYVAVSIDGYIADRNGSADAFPLEGDHFDALVADYPETFPAHVHEHFGIGDLCGARFDTVLMGRRTYQPALSAGITSPYPHLTQYVFSRSLEAHDDSPTITADDPLFVARELKDEEGKDIWLCGGGELAGALAGEIDELIVKRNPIVLGGGTPMFAGTDPLPPFDVVDFRGFDSGASITRYRR